LSFVVFSALAPSAIYSLSLHDALPISVGVFDRSQDCGSGREVGGHDAPCVGMVPVGTVPVRLVVRSTVNAFTASVDGSHGPRLGSAGGVLDDSRIIADRGLHRSVGQNAAAESGGRLADDAAEEAGGMSR